MTRLKALLSRGYLPREIPPPFTTEAYARAITRRGVTLPKSFTSDKKPAKPCRHSLARVGIRRRQLSIPNPVLHYNLCREIADNWRMLVSLIDRSKLSKSIPKMGPRVGRALLPSHDYPELLQIRSRIRATSKYLLRADISSFYPSIYTHSLAWTIHGKGLSKRKRGKPSLLGNRLDRWIRNAQDKQTIGIPIGPDTSLVIAETILSAVDKEIQDKIPNVRGMRHIDDFEFGFKTYADAEGALADLQEVLRDFELELKPEKTSIIPLPIPQQPSWVVELRNHQFRSGARAQWGDLMSYFDRAFVLAQANPKMIVLKYAVQRIRYQKIAPSNWPLVQEFLFQCLMVETGTFYPVLKQLVEHHVAGRHVDLSAVEEIINYHIVQHCRLGHGSEAAWSVWAAIRFEIPLDKSAAAALSGVSDSIVALLSLDAHHAGLIPSGLDTSHWQTYMTAEALYGEAWLLSYEANVKGWLKSVSGKDHVASDSNFSFLKSEGVCFYDEKRARTAIPTGASVGAGKAPIFSFPV